MKRKPIKAILLIAVTAVMLLSLTACVDDKDDVNGASPENSVNQQSSDGISIPDIPTGTVSENQQTFEINQNDPENGSFSHSFSIDENDLNSSHSVSIDENGNIR